MEPLRRLIWATMPQILTIFMVFFWSEVERVRSVSLSAVDPSLSQDKIKEI